MDNIIWTTLLLLFIAVQADGALECTLTETISSDNISSPQLTRQRIFDENFVFYNRNGTEMMGKKMKVSKYFTNSTEFNIGHGQIIAVSQEFQNMAVAYSTEDNGVRATFVDIDTGLKHSSLSLFSSAEEYDADLPFGAYFHVKVGHLAFANKFKGENSSFTLKRTGERFTQLPKFESAVFTANATSLGILRAFAVDSGGQMLMVVANHNNTEVSTLTYKVSGQETVYAVNRVQSGFPIPVLIGNTVQAVGSGSTEGAFLLITTRYENSTGLTYFQTLHTANYGYTWTESLEVFSVARVNHDTISNTGGMTPVQIVWLSQKWIMFINTFDGILQLDLQSKVPFKFEWTDALQEAQYLMFQPNTTFTYLPPRTTNGHFTLAGIVADSVLLQRYTCSVLSKPSAAVAVTKHSLLFTAVMVAVAFMVL